MNGGKGRALQQSMGAPYVASQPTYLTLDEGARLLRFDVTAPSNPVDQFRRWLHREAVPILRRGRVLLVERAALDAAIGRH